LHTGNKLYKKNPYTIEQLKEETSAFVINIDDYSVAGVLPNFQGKLQMALAADDAHMKTFSLDFPSPKVIVLSDTERKNNCHVF
jgi:hypothetical protein